jgi:hypothetical protein
MTEKRDTSTPPRGKGVKKLKLNRETLKDLDKAKGIKGGATGGTGHGCN